MSSLYDRFEVSINDRSLLFEAHAKEGKMFVGPYEIKYKIWDSPNWSRPFKFGLKLSFEQWRHFKHDLNPSTALHFYLSQVSATELYLLPDQVRTVVEGYAEHLSRGNSWNGYRVLDKVVKLSSIVPYVWQNSHAYLNVAESFAQAMREVNINQTFMANPKLRDRICPITRVDKVAQKLAVTMPYLNPIAQLSNEQALYLEETIHRMHRAGWAYLDKEIGYGLGDDGMPKIYDLSTVRHRSECSHPSSWPNWIYDDRSMISRLRERQGLGSGPIQIKVSDVMKRRYDKIMRIVKERSSSKD